MPYHVVVTRQVLLDGPTTFRTTLTLLLLVRYELTQQPLYLMGVGATLGLIFLPKETGIVFAAALFVFLALTPAVKIRFLTFVGTGLCALFPIFMFPLSITLAGRGDTAKSYLVWQLLRPSNHEWTFFFDVVPPAMGWGVLLAAALGFVVLRLNRTRRETLLLCWLIVPLIVFQVWPVKGFQYLLPIAPPIAILAARTLTSWRPSRIARFNHRAVWFNAAAVVAICLSLFGSSFAIATERQATSRMAGAGGIPGVRETGEWIQENLPENAVLVAVGPSMANLIQFYGHRRAYGLSVSTNPLNRNPSYLPLVNPDARFRNGDVQYIVMDSFSASRSPFFTQSLMKYVEKSNAREIYSFAIPAEMQDEGGNLEKIIVIYEVPPQ